LKNPCVLPVALGCVLSALASQLPAQTFRTLHSFLGGSDGAAPYAALSLLSNVLYGTTYFTTYATSNGSGAFAGGTIFSIHADGSGFTTLFTFPALRHDNTSSNGTSPIGGLTLAGNSLYGTAANGGPSGNGTVFSLTSDGSGFKILHSFQPISYPAGTNSDGAGPNSDLILEGNTLYGTAGGGGAGRFGGGTVFSLNIDGSGFTVLHSFDNSIDGSSPNGLVMSGSTLYGTTGYGTAGGYIGDSAAGTVFSVNTDGTGFTNLHNFTGGTDGAYPKGGLILAGDTLYGTTGHGGGADQGTVFSLKIDGSGFTILHSFTARSKNSVGPYTNSDGAEPVGRLTLLGNTLYGAAISGGGSGRGTIFAINTDGTGFAVLHSFTSVGFNPTNSEGIGPNGGLLLSGTDLYGTALAGGSSDNGTVFGISFLPKLTLVPSATNVALTWTTNVAGFDYAGFTLQSTTNLASPVWTTNLPAPIIVNGQYTVTNPISGNQQFFRLSQ
jgi:uncharacterized repeat protein (TIGR03803 family)